MNFVLREPGEDLGGMYLCFVDTGHKFTRVDHFYKLRLVVHLWKLTWVVHLNKSFTTGTDLGGRSGWGAGAGRRHG